MGFTINEVMNMTPAQVAIYLRASKKKSTGRMVNSLAEARQLMNLGS